ncbi:TPA: YoaH family protein, partial [Shigella flexneri]|nr:YoaH family protein [Shigella flexneri]
MFAGLPSLTHEQQQ